jgi:hypothetical protein
MRRINLIAVVVSWVVDIAGSNVLSLVYGLGAMISGQATAATFADQAAMLARPDIYWSLFALGLAVSGAAGYLAARIAGHDQVLHGFLSSVGALGLGLVTIGTTLAVTPLPIVVFAFISAPLAGAAGGALDLWRVRRRAPVNP